MSDLEKALSILETKFGAIGNIKFLLADGVAMDSVAADFLATACDAQNDVAVMKHSYPEPHLAACY